MPFKRISINKGCQPRTPLSVAGDQGEETVQEEQDESFLTLTADEVGGLLLMRDE